MIKILNILFIFYNNNKYYIIILLFPAFIIRYFRRYLKIRKFTKKIFYFHYSNIYKISFIFTLKLYFQKIIFMHKF